MVALVSSPTKEDNNNKPPDINSGPSPVQEDNSNNKIEVNKEANVEQASQLASSGELTKAQVKQRASGLLQNPGDDIAKPILDFFNVRESSEAGQRLKESFLNRRKKILEALAAGKEIFFSTDMDGTVIYKNPVKAPNTRTNAGIQDIHWLRVLIRALSKLGFDSEINTARFGLLTTPNIISPEGFGGFRTMEETSGTLEEIGVFNLTNPENKEIFKRLIVNGFSSGATHKPGEKVKLKDKVKEFSEFIELANNLKTVENSPNGFLSKIDEICANKGDNQFEDSPIRMYEYKYVPRIFYEEGFKLDDYLKTVFLYEESKKKNWSSAEFINRFNKLGVELPERYAALLNPSDPQAAAKLAESMRGNGYLGTLTPHAMDTTNVERYDIKRKIYQTVYEFTQNPEVQEWAHKKFGYPLGHSLFTINGKDVSHITDFMDEKQIPILKDFIVELKKGNPRKDVLLDIKDNNQIYMELSPATTKDEVVPDYNFAKSQNLFTLCAGDSPGTDARFLAQSVIDGGLGFKVRGLMSYDDIFLAMTELLAEPKNQGHPDGLEEIEKGTYRHLRDGSVKPKEEWARVLEGKYANQITPADNMHLNNAFNAAIFSEFFQGEQGFDFLVDPNAEWVKDCHEQASTRTIMTPDADIRDKFESFPEPEKTRAEKSPLLAKLLGPLFEVTNTRRVFTKLFGFGSSTLMGAGALGVISNLMGSDRLTKAFKVIQRIGFAVNTFASGIGRGLVKPSGIKATGQFWGEMMATISNFFPLESYAHKMILAMGMGMTLFGRGTEILQAENHNLDTFVKTDEAKAEIDQVFGKDKEKFEDIRPVAAELTHYKRDIVYKLHRGILGKMGLIGDTLAESLAEVMQAFKIVGQFISTPALRHGALSAMFTKVGIPKTSMVSGREYRNVHSPGHVYTFTGILTMFTGLVSSLIHPFLGKSAVGDKINWALTTLTNLIPTWGVVTQARSVEQDVYGQPRTFSAVNRDQVKFTPEISGKWQKFAGWAQALTAPFLRTDIGQLLYNTATGMYLRGVRDEVGVGLDDYSQIVGRRTRKEPYSYTELGDQEKPRELINFVRDFHKNAPELQYNQAA